MFRRVSTEAAGWRDALTTREIALPLVWRLVLVAVSTAAGVVAGQEVHSPGYAVLWVTGVVLVASLARLRVLRRP